MAARTRTKTSPTGRSTLAGWKSRPSRDQVIYYQYTATRPEAACAARPIYHHKRQSIKAHLTIVCAALAVSRRIEYLTRWSIRTSVRTARRYRPAQIPAGPPHRHRRRPAAR